MTIAFNEVPRTIRTPGVFVELDPSQAGGGLVAFRSLLIGQRLGTGAIAEGVPRLVGPAADAQRDFGAGSQLDFMAQAFRRNNPLGELWAVALNDAVGATQETVTITVTAAATAAGTIALYINARRIAVGIDGAATTAEVAQAIEDAIDALGAQLPVTAAIAGSVVTLTARHGGTIDLDVRANFFSDDAYPAGVAITIAVATAGATDPNIQDALDALSDAKFDIIAHPYTASASMVTLEDELTQRWGPLLRADGFAISALRGTVAAATTYGNARNSAFSSVMDMATSPTSAHEWAAASAGRTAQSAEIDPARPFQTLQLLGVLPAAPEDQRTHAERAGLLTDGIATHTVDADGSTVRIERLITTYQSRNGVPDTAYLNANTPLTLSFIRADFVTYMRTTFPRHKLADDGTRFDPGQPVITPSVGRGAAVGRFRRWERRGLVEGAEQFKAGLIVVRNEDDPDRLDFRLPPDLINQLRVVGAQIQFIL